MIVHRKKCLFFVQGEGRGHMTQSISMKQILEAAGIEVCEVLIGKSKYRKIPDFYFEKIGVPVTGIDSPNMTSGKQGKKIKSFTTFLKNLSYVPRFIKSLKVIGEKIEEHKPDIIINFYEPLCGLYYLLHKPAVPMVAIGHQFMFLHEGFIMPSEDKLGAVILKQYTRFTAARATKKLALSFYPFPDNVENSIYVVPPLLRHEAVSHPVGKDNYLLIYILNSGYMEDIIKWHQSNPGVVLHCFTDKKDMGEVYKYDDTLTFHALNDKLFLDMMANAKGVVSTAGFESVCEAMYMGKPVFMVPVENHYEQFCNSRDAAKTGNGIYDSAFNIDKFLQFLSTYTKDGQVFRNWADQSSRLIIKQIKSVLQVDNVKQLSGQKGPYREAAQ